MSGVYHLAEINIARLRAPLEDPIMADFVAQLDSVNLAAERSPGFVWRLKSESGGASTYIRAFDDPLLLINISVWDSIEHLREYVYRMQEHGAVFRNRRKWFDPLGRPPVALWWIPSGTIPSVEQAIGKLDLLDKNGPTRNAFTFKHPYSAPQGTDQLISA